MVDVIDPIHDDEINTSESVIRSLLTAHCPQWADLPTAPLDSSGTSNSMWRIDVVGSNDIVVRVPRNESAAASVERELALLPALAASPIAATFAVPTIRHAGEPAAGVPFRWLVLDWIDGSDAWSIRHDIDRAGERFALQLAEAVIAIGDLDGLPAPSRRPGQRGGPLGTVLDRLAAWLTDPNRNAAGLVDVDAVRRVADESREVVGEPVRQTFVHGDLIPGNLLTVGGRLTAVIDWGGSGFGDPAQDLAPAWAVLDRRGRAAFREAVAVDEATWLRARALELEQAVLAILYYAPRNHLLADVMRRTLDRVLDDADPRGAAHALRTAGRGSVR